MEIMTDILWMVALWWMISRIIAAIQIIRYQNILKNKKEMANVSKEEKKEQKEVETLEMVQDAVCGKFIEKSQSYQLVTENGIMYFCSWDCRQKYIKEHKQSE
ncbi:hypothetical protein [Defluviitalea phaphyphila]|uniref:hypothetical protein n=1 Tax=Defluviitalea phaphyphila TaxID=1473580 RepID=UPI00073168E9|nr:hypothetical protein [Defluviitalea phaphyphila]